MTSSRPSLSRRFSAGRRRWRAMYRRSPPPSAPTGRSSRRAGHEVLCHRRGPVPPRVAHHGEVPLPVRPVSSGWSTSVNPPSTARNVASGRSPPASDSQAASFARRPAPPPGRPRRCARRRRWRPWPARPRSRPRPPSRETPAARAATTAGSVSTDKPLQHRRPVEQRREERQVVAGGGDPGERPHIGQLGVRPGRCGLGQLAQRPCHQLQPGGPPRGVREARTACAASRSSTAPR